MKSTHWVFKEQDKFTDTVDADFITSLIEYSPVRNPKTNESVFFCPHTKKFYCLDITLTDVEEALHEVRSGYFDFIGSDILTELKNLDNDYLSGHIMSLNMYSGAFDPHSY